MKRSSCLGLIAGLALAALPARADDLHPDVAADLSLELVLSNLSAPTGGAFLPDGRLLIIEQFSGRVQLWDGQSAPRTVGTVEVQTGNERGLLGVAVDPEFETSRRIYFYYSTGGAQSAGYALMDPATGDIDTANMVELISGMAAGRNHNGGAIGFGPDGHLYLGVGDTGCNCGCAPGTNTSNYFGTCLTGLNGKILRIDRDGGIPSDNPLVGVRGVAACGDGTGCRAAGTAPTGTGAPRTEIYNWGFRNPFRFAFDAQTGYLWVGDVGEITNEEITISTGPGQHHGWPYREGREGQPVTRCGEVTSQSGDCTEPAVVYPRSESPNTRSASVTAGVFSQHCSWPQAWRGRYWFGDYSKARVWAVTPNAARDGVDGARTVIATGVGGVVQFMESPDGGVYYLNVNTGTLWRIVPANPEPCPGTDAGVEVDSGPAPDVGPAPDTGVEDDSGSAPPEAGVPVDGGVDADAGTPPAADAGEAVEGDGDGDGCRCIGGSHPGAGAAGLALLLLGAHLGRPRRRR